MRKTFILLAGFVIAILACGPNKQSKSQFSKAATPPNPSVQLELKDANQLLTQRRCAEAVTLYLQYLSKYPKDQSAWNYLGLAYLCDGKNDQAITSFQKALSIAPMYTDVHNNLGVAYMEMKNYPEAKKEFMKALEDVNYPVSGPYFNLAKMAFEQQSYEESRALSKKVIDTNANLKQAAPMLLYGLSLEKLGRIDEACDSYRTLLKVAPDNIEATYYLAGLLVQKNQGCEARVLYNRVVDSDPLGELGQKSIAALKTVTCPAK
jgi:tetratricopeptide (TPR) repeat protein